MKKYKFEKYNEKFPSLFEKEKYILKNIIPDSKIEHIGSTAIKKLSGKGIIDIMISVPKNKIKNVKKELIEKGYIFKKSGGGKREIIF